MKILGIIYSAVFRFCFLIICEFITKKERELITEAYGYVVDPIFFFKKP